MDMMFYNMAVRRLIHVSFLFLLYVTAAGGSLLHCLITQQHCLGGFMPVAYSMQAVDIPTAVTHLDQQCPQMDNVQTCLRHYRCEHVATRRRTQAFADFFSWLCQNKQVLEASSACWENPFAHDIRTCGSLYIAGSDYSRLVAHNHPCPFIGQLVTCVRGKMLKRAQCSEEAATLYIGIITRSSQVFSSCGSK